MAKNQMNFVGKENSPPNAGKFTIVKSRFPVSTLNLLSSNYFFLKSQVNIFKVMFR